MRFAIRALQHGAAMVAATDGGVGEGGAGMSIKDPTQLKVSD